jgi:uncharacterized membrane protein
MIGALIFVLGVMILFALLFSTFLILPFFIFLAGIVAMLYSDRKNASRKKVEEAPRDRDHDDDTEVTVVETRTR